MASFYSKLMSTMTEKIDMFNGQSVRYKYLFIIEIVRYIER